MGKWEELRRAVQARMVMDDRTGPWADGWRDAGRHIEDEMDALDREHPTLSAAACTEAIYHLSITNRVAGSPEDARIEEALTYLRDLHGGGKEKGNG